MTFNNHPLITHAEKLQTLITSAEFTDEQRESLPYSDGFDSNLKLLKEAREKKSCVFLVGNGGSAAIVSHIFNDLINVAKLRAFTLHESSMVTCMSNDYGYENVYSRPLSTLAQKNDLLIAVSSSGKSPNILNAANCMKEIGGTVITLSGFSKDNPLRKMGSVNFWLNSNDYGLVEVGHMFFLHCLSDHLKP
ncbi:MAG: SIS domain-containing protein [Nitrospinae bacterium]|nr:SIS domain-containing protein [Nitrospinota bacterium]